jgi:O-antigen/teichoic acid export membrane protein
VSSRLFAGRFAIVLVGQEATLVFGLLNSVLTARLLGPAGRGEYALFLSLVEILSLLASCGIYWSLTYWLGKDPELLSSLATNALLHIVLLTILALAIAPLAIWAAPRWLPNVSSIGIALMLAIIPATVWAESIRFVFLGRNAIKAYTLMPVVKILLWFLLNVIALGILHLDVVGAMLAWLIQVLVTDIAFSIGLLRQYRVRFLPQLRLYRQMLRTGARGLVSQLGIKLMYSGDIYFLNRMVDLEQLGLYSVATSVTRLMERSTTAAGTLIFPISAQDKTGSADRLTARVLRHLLLLNLAFSVFAILVGQWLLILLFGQQFIGAYALLLLLIPGFMATASPIVIGPNLWGKGYPKIVMIAPYVSFVVDLAVLYWLVPRIGIAGAAIGSSVAYMVWAVLLVRHFRKIAGIPYRELLILQRQDWRAFGQILTRVRSMGQK